MLTRRKFLQKHGKLLPKDRHLLADMAKSITEDNMELDFYMQLCYSAYKQFIALLIYNHIESNQFCLLVQMDFRGLCVAWAGLRQGNYENKKRKGFYPG